MHTDLPTDRGVCTIHIQAQAQNTSHTDSTYTKIHDIHIDIERNMDAERDTLRDTPHRYTHTHIQAYTHVTHIWADTLISHTRIQAHSYPHRITHSVIYKYKAGMCGGVQIPRM